MSETSGTTAPQHYLGARNCGDPDIDTTSKWSHVSSCGLCCLLFLPFSLYDFPSLHLQTPFHSCSVVRRAGSSDLHGLPLIEVKLEVISNHSWWCQDKCLKDMLYSEKAKESSGFLGQVQTTSCLGPYSYRMTSSSFFSHILCFSDLKVLYILSLQGSFLKLTSCLW